MLDYLFGQTDVEPPPDELIAVDIGAAIEKSPRIDLFATTRDKHNGAIEGHTFPWSIPGAEIVDFYAADGWMVFLEVLPTYWLVRLRHKTSELEPSVSKLGITQLHRKSSESDLIIRDAIGHRESPLYSLLLCNKLLAPFHVRLLQRLPSPLDLQLTVVGACFHSDMNDVFEAMGIEKSIYARRKKP